MTLNTVELKWDLTDLIEAGLAATLSITPTAQLSDTTDHILIPAVARSVTFSGGQGQLAGIVANDNSSILPANSGYLISVTSQSGKTLVAQFQTQLNFANGAVQWLDALATVPVVATSYQYLPLPAGTPSAGQVPVATGTGEASAWGNVAEPSGAIIYAAPGGSDSNSGLTWATAKATITAAIAALPANGGQVYLGYGSWSVASASRSDTGVTYNSGTSTWSDSSITSGDVGKYVLGSGQQNRVPKITSVIAGTSFVTDVQPPGNISSETVQIITPAIVLPEGVSLIGLGSGFSSTNFQSGSAASTTKIVDTGSGVTILVRGAYNPGNPTQACRYRLSDVSVWGLASGTPGTNFGATFCGVYVGNNANWMVIDRCDFQFHGHAGIITDSNMNALQVRDSNISNNGTPSATTPGGGAIVAYYNNTASAGNTFDNCYFTQNYGCGIGWYIAGQGTGAFGVNLRSCQFTSTFGSAWGTYNGYGAILQTGTFGSARVESCWFENSVNGDLWVDGTGGVAVESCVFKSTVAATVYGIMNLNGCFFYQTSGSPVSNNGIINWMGCTTHGATPLWTSGPSATQLKGVGSSANVTLNGTNYTNP